MATAINAINRLKESLTSARPDRERLEQEVNATKPRYLFSAVLRFNCIHELCDFDWIEPGIIRPVKTHWYQADNVDRYVSQDNDAPLRIARPRNPAVIARRIIERDGRSGEFDTGLVLLDELTGLDADERQEDGALILDIQETLLPSGLMDTGAEQVKWLSHLLTEGFTGPRADLYRVTCERMLMATRQGLEYAEAQYADVLNNLSQRASGTVGYHNKASKEDARLIQWAGHEVPQLASPMVKAAAAQLKAVPAAVPMEHPQGQCEHCGTYVNLLSGGRMPKICVGCGEAFSQPEEDVPGESESDKATRLETRQAEMRARKK